jgi:hypothetical protein
MTPATQCRIDTIVFLAYRIPKEPKLEMRQREPAEPLDSFAAERAKARAFQRLRLACYRQKRINFARARGLQRYRL